MGALTVPLTPDTARETENFREGHADPVFHRPHLLLRAKAVPYRKIVFFLFFFSRADRMRITCDRVHSNTREIVIG